MQDRTVSANLWRAGFQCWFFNDFLTMNNIDEKLRRVSYLLYDGIVFGLNSGLNLSLKISVTEDMDARYKAWHKPCGKCCQFAKVFYNKQAFYSVYARAHSNLTENGD